MGVTLGDQPGDLLHVDVHGVDAQRLHAGVARGQVVDGGAGMLHPAVGVEQHRADHAHARPLDLAYEIVHPVGVDGLDVVVEEQQQLAARSRVFEVEQATQRLQERSLHLLGLIDEAAPVFDAPYGDSTVLYGMAARVELAGLQVR
mgnify:CR=1 FL=1